MRVALNNDPSAISLEWRGLVSKQASIRESSSFSTALKYPLKNRYTDVLPQDSSRVTITPTLNNEDGYINANYINLPHSKGIATQAPVPQAFEDFWQMIWVSISKYSIERITTKKS